MRHFEFKKSSYSGPDPAGQECVEVAVNVPGTVRVRDSKNPDSPALAFTPVEWTHFQRALAAGDFVN
ncbi:DUF397 domain-containing protein [Streptomyces sp. NPDC008317]|uniref:DUF397 domain-containing protein n=1 Tax=Streptomyces sp. NPDC008317 TaxID=3364827 RepID=UPI0036E782D1